MRGRRWRAVELLGGGIVAAALIALVLVLTLGGSDSKGAVTSNEAAIKRQLVARLHEHLLRPHWVACVPSGRRYEGAKVIRCNVNYGDPHIEAICSVLRDGELVTDHDEGVPCGPDLRGWHPIVETYE